MKKYLIILSFLFLPLVAFAQERSWRAGVKFLPEMSTNPGMGTETKSRITYGTGLQLIFPKADQLEIETGIYLHDKGDRSKIESEIWQNEYTIVDNYSYFISIPLLLKRQIGNKFYASAGPALDYYLFGKSVFEDNTIRKHKSDGLNFQNRIAIAGIALFGYETTLLGLENSAVFF